MKKEPMDFDFPLPNKLPKKPASSIVLYYDEEGNRTSKEEGVQVRIVEYDEDGHRIREIHGTCSKKKENKFNL